MQSVSKVAKRKESISSIVVEVIRTVLFFTKDILTINHTKKTQLTNIQPNIYKESHLNCPYKPLKTFY